MAVTTVREVRDGVRDEYEYESDDATNEVAIGLLNRPEALISVSVWDEDSVGGSIGDGTADITIKVAVSAADPGATLATYAATASQAVRVVGSWDRIIVEWANATRRVHVYAAATSTR